ncbi:MAG: efflux RND transporter periplasmic adaptor subunit [bacterium]|nr:efflux RND transporter periplasmic adaptor subunit [bacterium]
MKQITTFLITLGLLIFLVQCNKPTPGDKTGKQPDGHSKQKGAHKKKGDAKLDIDKLDIPQRMKDKIKSGEIPMSRVKKILERRKGTGNAPMVKVQRVKRQKINSFLALNGVVEPERQVIVYSRLAAYVKKILKEEGDNVQKNDTLALLDDSEIKISHRRAQLQLQQAKLTMEDENVKLVRIEKLFQQKMIAEQDFQAAKSAYNKAKLDFRDKTENYKELELQLDYTRIKAPVSGYITSRIIEVGTRVAGNQQVYTVEDFSPLLIKVYVPASDIVNLKKEMQAEVYTDVLSGMIFKGRIKLINPRIDVQSGTVKVTIEVFDNSLRLKPGMFVEAKILVRNNPNALVIPKSAIFYKNGLPHVYVFNRKEGTVRKQEVETGINEDDTVEIISGLDDSRRIVTVGVEGLKDNMKVKTDMQGFGRGRPGKDHRTGMEKTDGNTGKNRRTAPGKNSEPGRENKKELSDNPQHRAKKRKQDDKQDGKMNRGEKRKRDEKKQGAGDR